LSAPTRSWLNPMRARSAEERHRVSTPLELFFDLCFVVAVAQAGEPLHQDIAAGRFGHGVGEYAMVFFAIWWAWMNFTWFASSYDTDDDVYRLTTLVQIAGALVLAAGVEPAFTDRNFAVITVGYVIMRLALGSQWLRAAWSDPPRRAVALRYTAGIAVVQALWLLRLALPEGWGVASFIVLALADLSVPLIAERAPGGPTTWHPHHIAERYGLFTIIVLGESVSAATVAVKAAVDQTEHVGSLLSLAAAGLVIVFALWWLYFDRSAHGLLVSLRIAFLWGYGHYFIFASAASIGAGLAVVTEYDGGHADISGTAAGYAVALPTAVYLIFVWLLHIRPHLRGPLLVAYPVVAVLVLLAPLGPAPVHVVAGLLVLLVVLSITLGRRTPDPIDAEIDAE
jgi:low temperature requirement protein LtrA